VRRGIVLRWVLVAGVAALTTGACSSDPRPSVDRVSLRQERAAWEAACGPDARYGQLAVRPGKVSLTSYEAEPTSLPDGGEKIPGETYHLYYKWVHPELYEVSWSRRFTRRPGESVPPASRSSSRQQSPSRSNQPIMKLPIQAALVDFHDRDGRRPKRGAERRSASP
jgi:hypothetical protein